MIDAPTATTVNGQTVRLSSHPLTPLAHALRDEMGLTGTKLACEAGDCGSCTVLLDRAAVASCLVPLAHADGRAVTTIEGLADGDALHPVQAAMRAANASQCGYCIPGFVVAAAALVEEAAAEAGPPPDAAAITAALSGNLCRCTGYRQIIEAIGDAMAEPARAELLVDSCPHPGEIPQPGGDSAGSAATGSDATAGALR